MVPPQTSIRSAVCLLLLVVAFGCAGEGSDEGGNGNGGGNGGPCVPPETATVSYSQNIAPIFVARCTSPGCHVTPVNAESLNLEASMSYDSIVDVASSQRPDELLIAPGEVDASYLWRKSSSGEDIAGALMPLGCPGIPPQDGCLTEMELAAIRQWIIECAQNN
jgi:hypothetical protein